MAAASSYRSSIKSHTMSLTAALFGSKYSQMDLEHLEIPLHVLAGWSNVPFLELVERGPRDNVMSDWLRLVPFVMWAACYVVPEFV